MNDLMKKIKAYEKHHGELFTITGHDDIEYKSVELKSLKKGAYFKRSWQGHNTLIRNHYNRKDQFGPANFSCSYANDMNKEIFLKPTTTVFVEI